MNGSTIYFGSWVKGLKLWCSNWHAATRTWSGSINLMQMGNTTISYGDHSDTEYCESSAQPAHAIRGRSGSFVDAFGLICDEP